MKKKWRPFYSGLNVLMIIVIPSCFKWYCVTGQWPNQKLGKTVQDGDAKVQEELVAI